MGQFTVYENKNPRSEARYLLLLDAQADLLDELQTRWVIPLTKTVALTKKPIAHLTPSIDIDGEQYLLMTP
jgi:toxin CcdB